MQVTLKLFALLGKFLPAEAHDNQITVDVADATTVTSLIQAHNVPLEHCHLVLVNGVYIAPSERDSHTLKDGDALAIWPPVAGG